MEEYEVFDEYLKKTQLIRAFCEDREKLLFESIRIDTSTEGKVIWLNAVGKEIDKIIATIDQLTGERELPQSFKS